VKMTLTTLIPPTGAITHTVTTRETPISRNARCECGWTYEGRRTKNARADCAKLRGAINNHLRPKRRCPGSGTHADYVNGGMNQCPSCGRMVYVAARDGRVAVHQAR
jgi:hypothetical protein